MSTGWQSRPVGLVVAFLIMVGSLFILQGFFDRGDHRKAQALVRRGFQVNGMSIGRYLEEVKHPGASEASWDSDLKSSCAGYVEVVYHVPQREGPTLDYRFMVELEKKTVHPENALGRQVLEELAAYARKLPAPAPPDQAPVVDAGTD